MVSTKGTTNLVIDKRAMATLRFSSRIPEFFVLGPSIIFVV